ncbi:hypothetical protein [Sphingobium jiangsuense]|nr:hypothetical protein [Sphingobium jiangsuense]
MMWLSTNSIPQTVKQADSYIATNLKWAGLDNPPPAIATATADHIVLVIAAALVIIGLLAAASWAYDRWRKPSAHEKSEPTPAFDVADGRPGGASLILTNNKFVGVKQALKARGQGDTLIDGNELIADFGKDPSQHPLIDPRLINSLADDLVRDFPKTHQLVYAVEHGSLSATLDVVERLKARGLLVHMCLLSSATGLTKKPLEHRPNVNGTGEIHVDAKP